MISVSSATKTAWMNEKSSKEYELSITWDYLTEVYTNSDIKQDSINITASIMQSDTIEIGGCIARKLEVTFAGPYDMTGAHDEYPVSLRARANGTDWIDLFTGTVVSVELEDNAELVKITAYDDFYRLSNLEFDFSTRAQSAEPMTDILTAFCTSYSVTLDSSASLENGAQPVKCVAEVGIIKGADFLKALFQLNGCFGMFDGAGKLHTVYLHPTDTATEITYYSGLARKAGSFGVDQIRMMPTEESDPVYYPTSIAGDHVYTIQGNPFVICETTATGVGITNKLQTIAEGIFDGLVSNWDDITIIPFEAEQRAMPWMECGDKIKYYDAKLQEYRESYILSWTFKGDQACKNIFSADIQEDLGPVKVIPSDKQRTVLYSITDISNGDDLATGSIYLVYEN